MTCPDAAPQPATGSASAKPSPATTAIPELPHLNRATTGRPLRPHKNLTSTCSRSKQNRALPHGDYVSSLYPARVRPSEPPLGVPSDWDRHNSFPSWTRHPPFRPLGRAASRRRMNAAHARKDMSSSTFQIPYEVPSRAPAGLGPYDHVSGHAKRGESLP